MHMCEWYVCVGAHVCADVHVYGGLKLTVCLPQLFSSLYISRVSC